MIMVNELKILRYLKYAQKDIGKRCSEGLSFHIYQLQTDFKNAMIGT